jgi:hypothetical protein
MKTTVAKYDERVGGASISFQPIDASLIRPTARTYGKKDDAKPAEKPRPAGVGV